MNSIEEIFNDALCHMVALPCPTCKFKVDFYLVECKPFCLICDTALTATYEDLKPVGLLPKRAGILRFRNPVAR